MSSNKSIFHYVGIGALLWYVFRNFGNAIANRFQVVDVKFENSTVDQLSGLEFSLLISIKNLTGINLPIDSFIGRVRMGNYALADVFLNNPIVIEAGEIKTYRLNGFASFATLSTSVIDMIRSGQYSRNLFIDGNIRSSGLSYPFTESIRIL